jgi:hypothetical protein
MVSDLVLDDADATHSLLRTLGGMPKLKSLKLLNVYAREASPQMPDKWPELRSLTVVFTSPPDDKHGIAPIVCTMLKIPHLQHLRIEVSTRSVGVTCDEHRQIARALGSRRELKTLALGLKSKTPASALAPYIDFLNAGTELETFELNLWRESSIGSTVFNALIDALTRQEKLERVSLDGCQQGKGSKPVQLERMIGLPRLSRLDLADNEFHWQDLELMLDKLGTNTNLRRLDLSGVGLNYYQGQYHRLALALERNTRLEYIALRAPAYSNHLGPLVDAMQKNTSLQGFDFVEYGSVRGAFVEPTQGSMLSIKRRTDENRRNAWLALAQGGMRMLLRADDTLGGRAGTIALDHIGRDAATLGLVNKEALKHALDYRHADTGSAD